MKVLVTGVAGFIGRHVARLLLSRGHDVVGVDSLCEQVHGYVPREVPYMASMGLGDVNLWRTTVASAALQASEDVWNVDAVIHLAAKVGVGQSQYEPARYVQANVLETAQLWEAVIKNRGRIGRVVVASSMSLYGEGLYEVPEFGPPPRARIEGGVSRSIRDGWNAMQWDGNAVGDDLRVLPTPESKIPEPTSVYAQSKWDTERYSLVLGAAYKVPTVALRFFNCYGPEQSLNNAYTGVLAQFACRALNGRPALVNEDGLQSRDFVYVGDVAAAVVAAVEAEGLSGVFNVCTGHATTILELAEQWRRVAADFGLWVPRPHVLHRYRVGDVRHCIGDPSALRRATGWAPKVELADGLRQVAAWIRNTGIRARDRQDDANQELREAGLYRNHDE